jgi:protein-disulfide isomerase
MVSHHKQEQKEQQQEELQKQRASRKTNKLVSTIITTVIIIAIIFGGLYGLIQMMPTAVEPTKRLSISQIEETDQVKGNVSAKALIVEYSDFQCPACKAYASLLKSVVENRSDVAVVYRHFPLRSIHSKAQIAAQASEAAALQGKFWEFHDMLFEKKDEWESQSHQPLFEQYAQELGLDVEQFKNDLNSPAVKEKVATDLESATQNNLRGTPSFFINGLPLTIRSEADLIRAIERAQ